MTSHTPRRESGFTLVELLIVVLIIGILATIAIPVFNGQRNKAKNSASQSAVRNALSAAKSYAATNDTYTGLTNATLTTEESSLGTGSTAVTSPEAGAVPTGIYLDNVSATTARMCSISKGDGVYCINSIISGTAAGDYFGKSTGSTATLTAARSNAGTTAAGPTSW